MYLLIFKSKKENNLQKINFLKLHEFKIYLFFLIK